MKHNFTPILVIAWIALVIMFLTTAFLQAWDTVTVTLLITEIVLLAFGTYLELTKRRE